MRDPNFLKPKFSHLKDMMKRHKKASAEIEASNNPIKWMEDHKNMKITGKGIAFARGGIVKK